MKLHAWSLARRASPLPAAPPPPPPPPPSRSRARRLSYLVYRAPSYVRKIQSVLPAVTGFSVASGKFTHPVVIKAHITDETRKAWLGVSKAAREHILNRSESPYITPALIKWFKGARSGFRVPVSLSPYFEKRASLHTPMVPMELIRPARHARPQQQHDKESFQVQNLPLSAIVQAFDTSWSPPFSLYMAQVPIDDLPSDLRADLPVPYLIGGAAPADIYSSSVWLGTEPTYTSLHRDPNPNYFLQLCGRKHIRLVRPELGDRIFQDVQASIGGAASPRMRGPEMMTGPEKKALEHAIWADWFPDPDGLPQPSNQILEPAPSGPSGTRLQLETDLVWEAVVDPGDVLFIPTGWWHSVRSSHADARLNASANWWFRYRDSPEELLAFRRAKKDGPPPQKPSRFRSLRVKRKFLG